MEKHKSVKENYIWSTAYQVLILIVPLLTAPYIARTIGAEGIGIYSFTLSVNSYFVLFATLGTGLFGQRNIAYYRNNPQTVSRAFWEIFLFRLFIGLVSMACYGVFVGVTPKYRTMFLIMSINIINVVLDISWFFQGIEDFKRTVIRNLLVRVLNTAFIFLFIKEPADLSLYVLSSVVFVALGNLSLWGYLPRYIVKTENIRPFRNFKDIIMLFIPTVAAQVYLVLGKTLLGVITNSEYENGCLEQADKIIQIAQTLVSSVAMVVLPRVANLFAEKKNLEAKGYIYKSYRFIGMISLPIAFGLIGITKIFVPVFFGSGYDLVEKILPIMSVKVVVVAYAYVTGYAYLIGTKQQNIYTISVTIGAVASLFLYLLLIPQFGAIGVAIAVVSAEIIGIIIQIMYCCIKKQLLMNSIFCSFWKYLIASFVMLISLVFSGQYVSESLIGLMLLILQGILVYILGLVLLKDDFFLKNIKDISMYIQKIIKRRT